MPQTHTHTQALLAGKKISVNDKNGFMKTERETQIEIPDLNKYTTNPVTENSPLRKVCSCRLYVCIYIHICMYPLKIGLCQVCMYVCMFGHCLDTE